MSLLYNFITYNATHVSRAPLLGVLRAGGTRETWLYNALYALLYASRSG